MTSFLMPLKYKYKYEMGFLPLLFMSGLLMNGKGMKHLTGDPTFNQVGVDATHIKLVEGRDWASFLQLGKIVGQIKVKVIDYSCRQ